VRIVTNVSTQDSYGEPPQFPTIDFCYQSNGGYFNVSGNAAFCQLQYGAYGSEEWTDEFLVPIGNGELQAGTIGVRFRSATPGLPAAVSAGMSERDEPAVILSASGISTPGAGAGAMQLISTRTLVAPASAITFPAISQIYKHLYLTGVLSSASGGPTGLRCIVNGSSAANYFWGETVVGSAVAVIGANGDASWRVGDVGSNAWGGLEMTLPGYTAAGGTQPQFMSRTTSWDTAVTLNSNASGFWNSASPISAISFFVDSAVNFQAASTISLYGMPG
jgi:hypothetical protein